MAGLVLFSSPSQPAKPVFNALQSTPYGASPYAAPQPQRSSILPPPTFANTLQPSQEDSEPIRAWREKQSEEIKARDERDRSRRDDLKNKAEKDIDRFYEDYNKQKERNIRENKWVSPAQLLRDVVRPSCGTLMRILGRKKRPT